MEHRGSNTSRYPDQHSISDPRISNRMSNIVSGHFNKNIGNVSHSYNTTNINVGVYEESWWIQTWLSPLEPHRRHDDVSNQRVSSVGDWVLGMSEFESWSAGPDGAVNPALLCYGDPGVGKTYIR